MSKISHSLAKLNLSWYDRVLFTAIFFIHIFTLYDFFNDKVFKFDKVTLLVVFVILVTSFWTVFISLFARKQIKINNERMQPLVTENLLLLKDAGYKKAYLPIGDAFSIIHEIERNFDNLKKITIDDETIGIEAYNQFQSVCGHIVDAFQLITEEEEISVSIKLVEGVKASENSIVKNFVRDFKHSTKRHHKDADSERQLNNDTAYTKIFENLRDGKTDKRFFLSNDLPQEPYYKNPSFKTYEQLKYNPNKSPEKRDEEWLLPYRSTIVTGIFPNTEHRLDAGHLIGFLCIDSPNTNTFNSVDTDILTGVADGLYNVLKKLKDKTKAN